MTPAEEYLAFYSELGLTLSQWANVEHSLSDLVVAAVGSREKKTVLVGFFSIENFRSKLQFANNLSMSACSETGHLAKWQRLKTKAERLASRRNAVAHRTVVVFSSGVSGRRYALVEWLEFRQSISAEKPRVSSTKPPSGSLCLRDLIQIRYDFFELTVALRNLADEMQGRSPDFMATPKTPPSVAEVRRLLHTIIGASNPKRSKKK